MDISGDIFNVATGLIKRNPLGKPQGVPRFLKLLPPASSSWARIVG